MGCRGRWKKIIHSEVHEFQISADENSQLNFWKWKFWSGTVLHVQASEAEMFPEPPGEGVCRIHLNQHFCFSVAESVSGADSFLAKIMTGFLKILSLWVQLSEVISWHKTWQLHWSQWAAPIWTQVHSPLLTVYSLHCNKGIHERKLGLRKLLKNMNLCVDGSCVSANN